MQLKISHSERCALEIAAQEPLASEIPDKASADAITGDIIPGMRVYKRLVGKGLMFFTEEPLLDEDQPNLGTYNPVVPLTDLGRHALEAATAGAGDRVHLQNNLRTTRGPLQI